VSIHDRDELDEAYESGELSDGQYNAALRECDAVLQEYCTDIGKSTAVFDQTHALVNEKIKIGKLYSASGFQIVKEMNPWNTDDDKRFVFVVKFADNRPLAIKLCRNAFTTQEKVSGWKRLCKRYLELGIYCPQIVDSLNGRASETIVIDNDEYIVYAEEMKQYKAYDELTVKPDFESFKPAILASIGKAAANARELLPFPSVFCIYETFDSNDVVDENYENAENFCKEAKKHFPAHTKQVDEIWSLFLQKREEFKPIHRRLPKASFQADLNPSNILVDDDMNFAGYIDFNLSGTETVLSYIIISEVCGYPLRRADLDCLTDKDFLQKCDAYLYRNLEAIAKHYTFSDDEKENLCLCYNTVYPFSCWSVNHKLDIAIKENKPAYVKPILDWVYYQLNRNDIKI